MAHAASLAPADYAKQGFARQEAIAKERETRRQWRIKWAKLPEIYQDYLNKVDAVYEEHKHDLLPPCDHLYNSKLNERILSKARAKIETPQMANWPSQLPPNTNAQYGRLAHLSVDKYERYIWY